MDAAKILTCLTIIYAVVAADGYSQCLDVVSKSEWGGRHTKNVNYLSLPIEYVVIQHTVTSTCTDFERCAAIVRAIQNYHVDANGWQDIGYSFVVGGDGKVYEGVGWTRVGTHTLGYNNVSIGIGIIGSYEDVEATQLIIDTAHRVITFGKELGILSPEVRVVGAIQVSNTKSPGAALYEQIQAWPEWCPNP